MKVCTVCKKELPYTSYHKSKVTKDGFGYRCKSCDKEARLKYREDNSERFYVSARKRQLKYKYGITIENYEAILKKQGGVCACCGTEENRVTGRKSTTNFAVDHDHSTRKVRGLLCNQCNRAIGMLGDSVEGLEKALKYLKETH